MCWTDVRFPLIRAKQIKNSAVVNENPTDKLIRELREENERLKKLMEGKIVPTSAVSRLLHH